MALPLDFYQASQRLSQIHRLARARQVPPDYLLAACLSRASCRVTPRRVLPPIVGAVASLNTFFGLVGPSGAGKGIAMTAGVEALPIHLDRPDPVYTEDLGSGERLAGIFVQRTKRQGAVQFQESALINCPEIDTLLALTARRGSTLDPTLRKIYSGESFGHPYTDDDKRLIVPAHHARLNLLAGVQPARAGVLYGKQSVDGGLAQRLVLFDGMDLGAAKSLPSAPIMSAWAPPPGWGVVDAIDLPSADDGVPFASPFDWSTVIPIAVETDTIRAELIEQRWHILRGDLDLSPLDAHRGLNRLKVAGDLMLVEYVHTRRAAEPGITQDHWERAGLVLEQSDLVRARILDELPKADREYAQYQGQLDAIRRDSADEHRHEGVKLSLMTHIENHAQPDGCRIGCLKPVVSGRRRDLVSDALAEMVESGRLVADVRQAERRPEGEMITYWRIPR